MGPMGRWAGGMGGGVVVSCSPAPAFSSGVNARSSSTGCGNRLSIMGPMGRWAGGMGGGVFVSCARAAVAATRPIRQVITIPRFITFLLRSWFMELVLSRILRAEGRDLMRDVHAVVHRVLHLDAIAHHQTAESALGFILHDNLRVRRHHKLLGNCRIIHGNRTSMQIDRA